MKSCQFLNFSGGTILGWTNTFYNSERNKFCKDIKLHARRAQQLLGQDGEMKNVKFSIFNWDKANFQIIQIGLVKEWKGNTNHPTGVYKQEVNSIG